MRRILYEWDDDSLIEDLDLGAAGDTFFLYLEQLFSPFSRKLDRSNSVLFVGETENGKHKRRRLSLHEAHLPRDWDDVVEWIKNLGLSHPTKLRAIVK